MTDRSGDARTGRPRASSRETLAEAACELFLEQGYEATSVVDITTRAGVSRSSFFNYFSSKSDILWAVFDERLDAAVTALAGEDDVRVILQAIGSDFAPDSLALAIANRTVMGIDQELERERAVRQAQLGRAIAEQFVHRGVDPLHADVAGAGFAGAVLAAIWRWAATGAGRTNLAPLIERALGLVQAPVAGGVRQLRMVVHAPDFEAALSFYRDSLGLPERASFEGAGDARVVILDAGAATLELANDGQVSLIDQVETDGGVSDRIRVAFEVDDTADTVRRLTDVGARVEASARETPWRSLNARLRAPADLQVTVFQELGEP